MGRRLQRDEAGNGGIVAVAPGETRGPFAVIGQPLVYGIHSRGRALATCLHQGKEDPTGRSGDRAAEIEGDVIMTKKTNPHIGSSLESWLDEAGIREEVTVAVIPPPVDRVLLPPPAMSLCNGPDQPEGAD